MIRSVVFASCLSSVLYGCNSNVSTPFPPGLELVDENRTPPPTGTEADPFPELLNQECGNAAVDWCNGRGFVHASIEDVWAVLQMPEVIVDRRRVARYRFEHDVEPEYPISFRTFLEIDDFITVNVEQTWRQGSIQDDDGRIAGVIATYQKTGGTRYVRQQFGSIELTPLEDDLTEVSLVQRLDSTGADSDDIRGWQRDLFISLVEVVHGRVLPSF